MVSAKLRESKRLSRLTRPLLIPGLISVIPGLTTVERVFDGPAVSAGRAGARRR